MQPFIPSADTIPVAWGWFQFLLLLTFPLHLLAMNALLGGLLLSADGWDAVAEGEALPMAMEIAGRIASNAPLSNYIMIQALSRIADMGRTEGLFTESLCAALTQTSPDALEGLAAFLEKRAPKPDSHRDR